MERAGRRGVEGGVTAEAVESPGDARSGEVYVDRVLDLPGWRARPRLRTLEGELGTERVEAHSMAVLELMAEAPGKVFSREEILDRVWEGAFVGDHALTHAIWDLRRALGDDPEKPRYIETIPGTGYRLCCPAQWVESGEGWQGAHHRAPGRGKQIRAIRLSVVTGAFVLLVGGLLAPHGRKPAGSTEPILRRLTSAPGSEVEPDLSPDGELLVYAAWDDGDADLFLRPVAGGLAQNLTAGSDADDVQPALSPDGQQIAFRSDRDGGGLFITDLAGESMRRLTDRGWNPAWSPDGEWIAFATEDAFTPLARYGRSELWVVSVATGETRRLAAGDAVRPDWSPHGHRLAFWSNDEGRRDIFTVGLEGDEPVPVTDDDATDWDPAWSEDGSHLLFLSDRGGSASLWRVGIDERTGAVRGNPEPVTLGVGPTLAHLRTGCSGRCAVFSALEMLPQVRAVAWDPRAEPQAGPSFPVTRGSLGAEMPAISPDGEWVAFKLGGVGDIAVSRVDGSDLRKLTDDPYRDVWPRFSPDGETVAYASNRSGSLEIWSVDLEVGSPKRLTDLPGEMLNAPVWSPDGRSMLATSISARAAFRLNPRVGFGEQRLERLPQPDGDEYFLPWSWSPEGDRIAGFFLPPGPWPRGPKDMGIFSLGTGRYRRLDVKGVDPCWLADGRRLLYLDSGDDALVLYDTTTGESSVVLTVAPESLGAGYWLPRDDRAIVFTSTSYESDLWLLSLGPEPIADESLRAGLR